MLSKTHTAAVRATEKKKINFPQDQGKGFLGVMNLVPTPTTKNAPRTRTPRTEGHGGFFQKVFSDSLRPIYKKKDIFQLWVVLF